MKTLLTLLALLLATTAYADGDKGVYAGAGVGVFNVKIDSVQDVGPRSARFDNDDVTFKAFVGWRFGKRSAWRSTISTLANRKTRSVT